MQLTHVYGLILAAIGLIAAAAVISAFSLWSQIANYTVPWFCSSVAIALLLLSMTTLLARTAPSDIPWPVVVIVTVGTSIGLGIGMLIDASMYFGFEKPIDVHGSTADWIGFTIVLVVVFLVPRIRGKTEV